STARFYLHQKASCADLQCVSHSTVWPWRVSIWSAAPLPGRTSAPSSAYRGVFSIAGDPQRCPMAQKLFIGGLSFSPSNERLREVFAEAGTVESASVVTDRETGRSRGFGFVEMATNAEAEAAVKKLNGQEVDGRAIRVELAKPAGLGGGARGGGSSRS